MTIADRRLLPTLELDVLRTFVTICEAGNFSKAADRIGRTPSAVSLQVKKLEELVGHALFRRESRETTPTADGEALLAKARRLLALNDEIVADFMQPRLAGSVSLGAPNDSGILAIPGFLKRFASTHPHVQVDVVLDSSRALRRRCDQGELDLILFASEAIGERSDGWAIRCPEGEELTGCERVMTEELVWVGLKHGEASRRSPLPLALADIGCCWRAAALMALDREAIAYRIAYSSEHSQGQIAAVEADLAVAPLPLSVATPPFIRLEAEAGLPALGHYSVFMKQRDDAGHVAEALASHVAESFRDCAGRGLRLFA